MPKVKLGRQRDLNHLIEFAMSMKMGKDEAFLHFPKKLAGFEEESFAEKQIRVFYSKNTHNTRQIRKFLIYHVPKLLERLVEC